MITLAPADDPVYKPGDVTFENLDDTPEDYRHMLRTLVGKQLQGEIAACELFARAVHCVDEPAQKVELASTAKEEADHVAAVEDLAHAVGVDVADALARRRPLATHFLGNDDDVKTWTEYCVFKHLIDRCGRIWLWSMRNSSFAPHARVLGPILKDEARHGKAGAAGLLERVAEGERAEVQTYVDKWFPRAMQLLGRPGSEGNRVARHYGLKQVDSDAEMRKFVGEITPALREGGLTLPSPATLRERGIDINDVTW